MVRGERGERLEVAGCLKRWWGEEITKQPQHHVTRSLYLCMKCLFSVQHLVD